jgi:hypothetical protein
LYYFLGIALNDAAKVVIGPPNTVHVNEPTAPVGLPLFPLFVGVVSSFLQEKIVSTVNAIRQAVVMIDFAMVSLILFIKQN